MIARIHPRGTRVGGLLAYLFGPGRKEEHKTGQPVWYGGGRLAPDLTLPRLRVRWTPQGARWPIHPVLRPDDSARQRAYREAADTILVATDEMRGAPERADLIGQAGADALFAVAHKLRGRHVPRLHKAAELLDRAARPPSGRHRTAASHRVDDLRAMVRLIWLIGQVGDDRLTAAMLQLVYSLGMLAEALADLRETQQRLHQARAARAAIRELRDAVSPLRPGRLAEFEPVRLRDAVIRHPESQPTARQPRARGR